MAGGSSTSSAGTPAAGRRRRWWDTGTEGRTNPATTLDVKCSPWEDHLAIQARTPCHGEQLRPWVPSASSWPLGPVVPAVCPPMGITSLELEVTVPWPSLRVQLLLSDWT